MLQRQVMAPDFCNWGGHTICRGEREGLFFKIIKCPLLTVGLKWGQRGWSTTACIVPPLTDPYCSPYLH